MEESIISGNKLIAEFMGWKFTAAKELWDRSRIAKSKHFPDGSWTDNNGVGHGILLFNTSWDWLMPVVEKINKTRIPDNKFTANVVIWRTSCHINDDNQILIETALKTTLIDCVWQAVVQFITWYNSQPK